MTHTILVADDDAAVRTVVTQALVRAGFEVRGTGNAATLWQWVSDGDGDVVITDVVMPDENGLDLIPRIRKVRPELRVIVISAHSTITTAVRAAERGAFEYLPKPFDITELTNVVGRALKDSEESRGVVDQPSNAEQMPMIGRSPAMQEIYRTVARLVGTDLTTIITGESGTGKELIARALHDFGKRRNKPFIAINMAAIPKDLIENELFGHEKGAFTGATDRAAGCFERADGGTLFLDEIGDMPLDAQTRLLRVLQEGEYTKVGGNTPLRANVRIIAATHRDLRVMIQQGVFREDLFYRLNVVPLRLPPLRERVSDVPELVSHFLSEAANQGLPWKTIDSAALERLQRHPWPGNVRELENLVNRLVALHAEDVIDVSAVEAQLDEGAAVSAKPLLSGSEGLSASVERHLREYFEAHGDALPASGIYSRLLSEFERPLIIVTLEATRGNQVKTAEILGLNRNTLRKKIRELNIPVVRGGRHLS
ncbi:MAG: nitrogen regulation protein NR(I) [Magnetospiraceae bacterium]